MPGSVAVVGASVARHKFGNKAVRAHLQAGWEVVPVNPRGGEIEGLPVVASLAAAPRPLDRISVYLPPAETLRMLPEIAAAGAADTIFNPGSADRAVLDEARRLGIRFRSACSIVDLGLSPSAFPG